MSLVVSCLAAVGRNSGRLLLQSYHISWCRSYDRHYFSMTDWIFKLCLSRSPLGRPARSSSPLSPPPLWWVIFLSKYVAAALISCAASYLCNVSNGDSCSLSLSTVFSVICLSLSPRCMFSFFKFSLLNWCQTQWRSHESGGRNRKRTTYRCTRSRRVTPPLSPLWTERRGACIRGITVDGSANAEELSAGSVGLIVRYQR